ncbi:hypothetical protein [Actinokineospora alba]|uniref:hypothetical protein n=1 Tax=Actinokineospora alba TaxID=504798 RepID=UPI00105D1E4A|nr:hypothetical protein [Actinokineospora alba]
MKRSLSVVRSAALIGLTVALLATPAAIAVAAPVAPAGTAQEGTTQVEPTPGEKAAKEFEDASIAIAAAAKAAKDAAVAAKTPAEATAAKDAALKVKADAAKLNTAINAFLDNAGAETHEVRIKALQALERARTAAGVADEAIAIAEPKINPQPDPEPEPEPSLIFVSADEARRGEFIAVGVFCGEGEAGNFHSDAITFDTSTLFREDQAWGIGGNVKSDATPGTHSVTATCGDEKLTTSFKVLADPAVQATPPKADDVRRKTVIRPKGRIETGGGATAGQFV